MIDDKDLSINRSIKMWDNLPLDSRAITESLSEMDKYITYPYVGMVFYSKFEDDYYKVLSLEDGYKNNRNGEVYRKTEGLNISKAITLKNYFVGSYEQYTLKGNSNTMIEKAEIRNGYLWIIYHDGKETNVGYVQGDPGFPPQISENSKNSTDLENLVYKLDIKYMDEKTHLINTLTTLNLIGPYIIKIEDEVIEDVKTGYTIFTLSTGDTYRIGPHGIKRVFFEETEDTTKQYLNVEFNDGTIVNLGNVKGDAGSSFNLLGTLPSVDDLPTYNVKNGEAYIVGKNLYFYFNRWRNVGQIVGNDGENPEISVSYSVVKAREEDSDKRDILKITFFNKDQAISENIELRLAYSPDITVVSNNENEYKLRIHGKDNDGKEFTILTPNLKGKNGTSIRIKGSVTEKSDLLQYCDDSEIGDSYIIDNELSPIDGHLWSYTGDTSISDDKHYNGFLDVGRLKGPKGNNGLDGKKGDNGNPVKLKIEDGWLKYCYIDSNYKEVSEYKNLTEISSITGPSGISPEVSLIEEENSTILKVVDINGEHYSENLRGKDGKDGANGTNGVNGLSVELKYEEFAIYYRYFRYINNNEKYYPFGEEFILLSKIPKIQVNEVEEGVNLTVDDITYLIKNGKEITLQYNKYSGYLEWKYIGDSTWKKLVSVNAITGADGKNIEIGEVTTKTVSFTDEASVEIIENKITSTDKTTIYDFIFNIPRGDRGEKGAQGVQGISITLIKGIEKDGVLNSLEITTLDPKTNLENKYLIPVGDIKGNSVKDISVKEYDSETDTLVITVTYDKIPSQDLMISGLKGQKGEKGEDGVSIVSITSTENTGSSAENTITITLSNGDKKTFSVFNGEKGERGSAGEEIELRNNGTTIQWKYKTSTKWNDLYNLSEVTGPQGEKGDEGPQGEKGEDGTDGREIELRKDSVNIQWRYVGDSTWKNLISIEAITGPQGEKGEDGLNGQDGTDGREIELRKTSTNIQWRYVGDSTWNTLISIEAITGPQGEKGEDGLDGQDGDEVELRNDGTTIQWKYKTSEIWNDLITLEAITGPQGEDGQDGTDGREIELRVYEDLIQWKYITDTIWNDLITLEAITGPQGEKGEDGLDGQDAEISIIENENNTDTEYKLDISYTSKGETVSFTTPNLKGGINGLYEILETLPTKNTDDSLDINHIYMIKKENIEEIISGQPNYDKYIILNISEDKTITWEKIETAEASGNILVICEELPSIDTASTNFIYCLLTPEYQRGLNIGLTNDTNANKNHFEEWVVIETEDSKNWELLGPQIYRISASMIDYLWKFNDKFTVYDDWDTADDIPEYQRKNYGEATPLNNFIFRLVPNGSTYNLVLVKEVSGGKINKLSIAPQYKVTLDGTTYICTVTELDGTYDDSYTYYESDAEGNISIKTYSSEDDFGIQSVFSGVEVYGVYVADTVKKITRGFLYTSNMSAYHIPYDLEIIGDYAFYSTKSPTVQFEKLINNGKDVEAYPLEESKVKAIGIHAFDGNSNLAFLIRNDDGTTEDSNIVRTPATLKKIGDYAFYNTRIATLDTNLSSNLYIGDHSFVQCVHGGQTLSSTTYYTDATFLGVNGLTHDTINYSSAGVSNWFEGEDHAGHNFNFDSGHETDVLHVTLNSVDPDWSLQ